MIYKIGIISKRYLIMFVILRWHVQHIIVWSQIVHQAFNCTCLDALQIGIISKRYVIMFPRNRYLIMFGIFAVARATFCCLVTDCAPGF